MIRGRSWQDPTPGQRLPTGIDVPGMCRTDTPGQCFPSTFGALTRMLPPVRLIPPGSGCM